MIYLLLKAAHLFAMVVWLSAMIVVPLYLSLGGAKPLPAGEAAVLRRVFSTVATPAMIALWVIGITLAQMGGAFTQAWLMAKLVGVFVLSGLHGVLAGQLRRIAAGAVVPAFSANLHWMVLGLLGIILLLAVQRPF